jgi:hypothetical protein
VNAWELIDQLLERAGVRIGAPTPGQTTGGTHVNGSFHYEGRARDYGRSTSDVRAITQALLPYATGDGAPIVELFDSTSGVFMDNGVAIKPSEELRQGHYDHVHVALRAGATLDGTPSVPSTPLGTIGRFAVAGVQGVALQLILVAGGVALLGLGAWRSVHKGAST